MVDLITSIKDKKEFSTLPTTYVKEKAETYFKEHPKTLQALEKNKYNEKSKEYKQAVKEIRAHLREVYGVFQKASNEKRKKLLHALNEAKGRGEKLAVLDKLLASHQSTKERKDHYQDIYKQLFAKEPPQHVLDLGCGLNPLAYHWLPGTPTYDCCDLSEEDMALISSFFTQHGIEGETYACDLLKPKAQERLTTSTADTALMLKLVDTLESQERDSSKSIINALLTNKNVRRIIISFPQKSIGGRTFRTGKKENWFTAFLTVKDARWETLSIGDEEFYDIRK